MTSFQPYTIVVYCQSQVLCPQLSCHNIQLMASKGPTVMALEVFPTVKWFQITDFSRRNDLMEYWRNKYTEYSAQRNFAKRYIPTCIPGISQKFEGILPTGIFHYSSSIFQHPFHFDQNYATQSYKITYSLKTIFLVLKTWKTEKALFSFKNSHFLVWTLTLPSNTAVISLWITKIIFLIKKNKNL